MMNPDILKNTFKELIFREEEKMNFVEAVKEMGKGKKVRLSRWTKESFIFIDKDIAIGAYPILSMDGEESKFIPNMEEIVNDTWVVHETKEDYLKRQRAEKQKIKHEQIMKELSDQYVSTTNASYISALVMYLIKKDVL